MTEGERVILDLVESGFFRIDEDGSIWRMQKRTNTGAIALAEPVRAEHSRTNGSRRVRAMVNGRQFSACVHRIVWMAEHGPLPGGPVWHLIDPEIKDRIVSLTRQGKSASCIAQALGVTTRAVTRERARERARRGIPGPANSPLTDDEKRVAAALLDDGAPVSEVARTLGRNPTTIHRHFPGRAWTPLEAAQFAAWRRHNRGALDRQELS